MEINSHMTHLQLILESHPLKHLTYMIERSHPLGKLTFLSIKSHKSLNKNPIIYAGEINGAFIQIEDNRQIELEINFVDLENFQLFPSKNQPLTINLIFKMSNSTIRNHELTIGSFINNLFYWATTVSEVRGIYKSIIQRDEASFNLYLQKHFLFEIAKQVIRGVYNSFHESRGYSGRIGHFLDLFPSRVTISDVKTIYDDILQNNIQKARDMAKISEQKFDLLVEYIKADIKTITFLNVNLASGSRVAFRNCSVKYGGKIHIRMLEEEEEGTFVLEDSTVTGSIEMNLQGITQVIIKNCIFHNIINTKSILLYFYRCNVLLESISLHSCNLYQFLDVRDSTLTATTFNLNSVYFNPNGWYIGALISLFNSKGTVNNLSVKNIDTGWGTLITVNSKLISSIENVTIESSYFGQYFLIEGPTYMNNLVFVNCTAQTMFQFLGFAKLMNIFMQNNKPRVRLFHLKGANVTIANSKFDNNSGLSFSYTGDKSYLYLDRCNFTKNRFSLYLVECKSNSFLRLFGNEITSNYCDGLFKAVSYSTIDLKENLVQENRIKENILEIVQSKVFVIETTITSNRFNVFVRCLTNSVATIDKVYYFRNNATGEGYFSRTVNSTLNLINTIILSENSGNSLLNLCTSRVSSSNTSIQILNSSSKQIPILKWNIERSTLKRFYLLGSSATLQLNMLCPPNFNFNNKTTLEKDFIDYEISCQACPKGTYSLKSGKMSIISRIIHLFTVYSDGTVLQSHEIPKLFGYNAEKSIEKCKQCPPGGKCETNVTSRKNFYGYVSVENELEFIPCPSGYCCSTEKECRSIESCRQNRIGRLCGKCKKGYQISYATNKCFKSDLCTSKHKTTFWIFYFILPMILASVLSFAKAIKEAAKKVFKTLKDKTKKLFYSLKRRCCCFCCCYFQKKGKRQVQIEMSSSRKENNVDDNLEPEPKTQCYSFSAIFSILVSFYQIKSLVEINRSSSGRLSFIDNILNLRFLMMEKLESYCPFINLDTITSEVLKGYGVPFVMVTFLAIMLTLCGCFKVRNKFSSYLYVGFYIVISFCFKDLSNVSLKLTNCVTIEDVKVLYISGDVICSGHWWQYLNGCFIGLWLLPFPVAVVLCYSLIRRKAISTPTFLACLAFPIVALFVFIYHHKFNKSKAPSDDKIVFHQNVKTHLKEIFEDPYKKDFWWWEIWRMGEKLIFNVLAVFLHDILNRIYAMTVVLLVLAYIHFQLEPYKKEMIILYRLDIVSFICLFFHLVENLIRAFVFVYGSPVKDTFNFHFESVLTPLWYLPIYLVVRKIKVNIEKRRKVKNRNTEQVL